MCYGKMSITLSYLRNKKDLGGEWWFDKCLIHRSREQHFEGDNLKH